MTLDALAAGLGASRNWGDDAAIWAAIREQVGGYRHVEPEELRTAPADSGLETRQRLMWSMHRY